eukprot:SAG11_NODE_1171_length_5613_cov_16.969895_2_plen_246_part_00
MTEEATPDTRDPGVGEQGGIGNGALSVPTKKGKDREIISLNRDIMQLKSANSAVKSELEDQRTENSLLSEAKSELELQVHKLSKARDKEANEHKKWMLAAEKRTKELADHRGKSESERQGLQSRLSEAEAHGSKLAEELKVQAQRMGQESTALRRATSSLLALEKKHGTLMQKSLRSRDTVVKLEGELRDTKQEARLVGNDHTKLESKMKKQDVEVNANLSPQHSAQNAPRSGASRVWCACRSRN